MHEQMHQRTGEQQQKRQCAKQVGTVFGKQKKCSNHQKGNQNPTESPWSTLCSVSGMFVMFHYVLLIKKEFTPTKISFYIFTRFSLSALTMTDTELKLIAAAAIIGESSRPKNGYSTPAAMGMPSTL